MKKAEKLLAARKKLREFQLNKVSQNPTFSPHDDDEQHLVSEQENFTMDQTFKIENNVVDGANGTSSTPKSDSPVDNEPENPPITHPIKQELEESLAPSHVEDNNEDERQNSANPVRELSDFFTIPSSNNSTEVTGHLNGSNFYSDFPHESFDASINREDSREESAVADVPPPLKIEPVSPSRAISDEKPEAESPPPSAIDPEIITSELQKVLAAKQAEFERVVPSLREEIRVHTQTIKILVDEKAELTSALSHHKSLVHQQSEESKELQKSLSITQQRVIELEKELGASKNSSNTLQTNYDALCTNYMDICRQLEDLKSVRDDQHLENAELRQDLLIKTGELSKLHSEIEQIKNSLSLAELRIQQLTNRPQELQELEAQQQTQVNLEQQLVQLQENYRILTSEKDDMCKHYENYVKQLDTASQSVSSELESARRTIGELEGREESLIQRLSLMEQQYQREKQRVESLLPLQALEEQVQHLTKSMDALVLEHEGVQSALQAKETEVESMRVELQELRELRDQSIETSKLINALESEQLGASRAVSQNQQLKFQLNEMHDAFVMLSNSKLDLTEQLQAERTVGRKLNGELSRMEADIDELKEELVRKDAVIDELNKEKLHTAQIADQMQHYQVQSYQARTLQDELKNALSTIEALKSENERLKAQLTARNEQGQEVGPECVVNGGDLMDPEAGDQSMVPDQGVEPVEFFKREESSVKIDVEAHAKLEARFKEAMEKVAELTDDKQRLEHLVLQLQGETETIGEYITLYQRQRAILNKRAEEREVTFRQLYDQNNQLQSQLHQLKVLIADFLKSRNNQLPVPELPPESASMVQNAIDPNELHVEQTTPVMGPSDPTAKILDLLSEIKDCKETRSLEPNFHPCLWCSGKLITI